MNKKLILIISLIVLIYRGHAEIAPQLIENIQEMDAAFQLNEVEIMDHLILVTQQNLEIQKKLRHLMTEFKKNKDRFFNGDQTKKHSFKMVKTASDIYQLIQGRCLQHLFSSEYLEELSMFSAIADKNQPVRP